MVGTPCQILAATKMGKFMDEFPVDLKIGLFCMENFSYSYMKEMLKEYDTDMDDVKQFRIEKGHLWLYKKDGKVIKIPLDKAKKCMRKNCQVCMDFTSEQSDVSVGSVGSPEGWSTVVIRTDKGLKLVEAAENDNYIETKSMSEGGLKIIEKLANEKKNENKAEIAKRENVARPVLYRRGISEEEFINEVSACQFGDLKGDVIDIGACVLCGACVYACPEEIVEIRDRKPQIKGNCPEGCNICYVSCPRTYVPDEILSKNLDMEPFGEYIKIVSAKAGKIEGQDGGVATALLTYALSNNMVDNVMVVDKSSTELWKPESKLTDNIAEVLKASGTKYAACPIFKPLKQTKEGS
ncbi:Coenzyme F420 hydrogenase/dehydrogenase, beta subunit C-terminal domain [Methanobacterium oryzae]|uniref:Coenzyme F420 hydrogenase/dehydrogenase, beta subunit C-terminal domain n=1 Tax=Methanobacterium oryzae TaxID=69540 RepID=UPI003D1BCC9A